MVDQVVEEGEVEMRLVPPVALDRPAAGALVRLELAAQGARLGLGQDVDREVIAVPAVARRRRPRYRSLVMGESSGLEGR